MTVDLNKAYKTKAGYEVKLFLIDDNRVLGAYRCGAGKWYLWSWHTNGKGLSYTPSEIDLVEVVEPVDVTVCCCITNADGVLISTSGNPNRAYFKRVYKKTVTFTEDDLLKD